MYAEVDFVYGACGVGLLSEFSSSKGYNKPIKSFVNKGGCNFLCAGFIVNDSKSDKVYNEIINRGFKEIFRTPVRKNVNSGNRVYFCVFDGGEEGEYGFAAYDKAYYNSDDDDDF